MAKKHIGAAAHDGVDGDDELDDEEDPEEEEEEDASSEEEEPRLKYQRMGGSVPSLLSADAASCLTVAERIIALGTHDGTVYLLDYLGNEVKRFAAHSATVNELSFDADGEFIGSCSDDGSVVINSLYTDEKEKFEYHRPMKAVALDPDYSRKASKQFAAGGLAGQLMFNSKGWFGSRDQVLHSGEGPVHAVKWRTSLIAWANDLGVKVYDTASHQRITFIERPKDSPRAELLRPHLVWKDDATLILGWANCVKIACFRTGDGKNGAAAGDILGIGRKGSAGSGSKYVEIKAAIKTEYYISGLAPNGDDLVVLAYIPEVAAPAAQVEAAGAITTSAAALLTTKQGHAHRPEVRIVTWTNEELATDALSIHGYEHYKAKDYVLAHTPFSGSSSAGGQWAAGDERLYYIVSPKDVVIARPRDADDHVNWLLEHGFHEKALAAVEDGKVSTERMEEVGSKYLDHLVLERQYAQAASLCPKLLRGSAAAWERWVFLFAHVRQLPVLAPYIPTSNPQLRDTIYEVVLNALLTNSAYHEQLLTTIRTWPSTLYSHSTIITAIQLQLGTSSKSDFLKAVLAELYRMDGEYSKALALFVELQRPDVFEYIEEHNLQADIHDKVVNLMKLNAKRTVALLVQQSDTISASEVVGQLKKAGPDQRQLLHSYLHALFEKDPNAGKDFHNMQVELYADFEPRLLLPFLRSSQHFNLDKAYEICAKRGLTRERVFLLGRMGNVKEALGLIINTLQDMEEAIKFITAQHDDELWEELINLSLKHPELVGALLEHTVGNIDPLHLVHKVPCGLPIPRLRDRLVKIITDYRTETSLRRGCNEILKADCVDLLVRYYDEARHAIRVGGTEEEGKAQSNSQNGSIAPAPAMQRLRDQIPSGTTKTGRKLSTISGSGLCCICLDPVALQNVAVVAFFCSHAYHVTCLNDTSGIRSQGTDLKKKESPKDLAYKIGQGISTASLYIHGDEDEDEEESGSPPMRCILCTTASAKNKEAKDDRKKSATAATSNGWAG
ncbi:vacuolar protein sorting-associated protein 41 [Marchantia polymorpha subsp. ruderalis]|uniref:Vacuolar protein sorting-associated protein 41 homolog n=2 Tax=Marchantia polymorpha TaxID=3197 RepID=A0AAF6BM62_MARPO|nr:hypothetical protein MARPO_0052s0125 [Marchantia polymorpha]BBN13096.1 hypothetical protein Mp_6g00750 [Marchantia polymorpha subsp. ruderalis]|eukprot:PTQ38351.1 hypothetical protein MARPO_0052s0125 [Marchantia polymorpha]